MKAAIAIAMGLMPLLLSGCMFGEKPAPREGPMEVGHFAAPPVGVARPRVAVAPFHVTTDHGFASDLDLSDAAADQMLKLLDATGRFNLIERVRLGQMLREQNISDALQPGEWARPVSLPGVDYVVIGRVLSLNATANDPAADFGMSKMQQMVGMGTDKNHRVNVTVTCNMDVRIVDPATGRPQIDLPRTFRRTANAATFGVNLAERDISNLSLQQNEAEEILRLILDEELRQMLPQIDAMLQSPGKSAAQPILVVAPAEQAAMPAKSSTTAPASAQRRICPECGADVSIYDEFCPNCNARLPHMGGPFTQPAKPQGQSELK